MRNTSHKRGEFFGFSEGEYSDYSFQGLYKCLRDLDMGELTQAYYDQCPPHQWDEERNEASGHGFGAWLIANNHVEEVDYDEIHCGSYGAFEVDNVVAHANRRASELAKG